MVTSTSVLSPDIVEPPAISMCIELDEFRAYLPENCSVRERNICPTENYSLQDIMKKYSGDLSQNIYFYSYELNEFFGNNSVRNTFLQNQTLQYYFDRHKCIRIPCLLNEKRSYNETHSSLISDNMSYIARRSLEYNLRQTYLLDTHLNITATLQNKQRRRWIDIYIMLHEFNKIAHDKDASVVKYYWNPDREPNSAKLIYYQVTTKYLKKPFAHACYDYAKDENMESRGDCQEKCLRDGILRKYGKVGRCLSTTVYDNTIPYDAPYQEEEIDKECVKKCPIDCKTIKYAPVVALISFFKYADSFQIQLLSLFPQTFVTYSPQFDLLSYLIYSGGTIGMWIGLSLFSTVSSITDYFIALYRKMVSK